MANGGLIRSITRKNGESAMLRPRKDGESGRSRCEEVRVKLELEAQAKRKRSAAFWADIRLAITILAKVIGATILLLAIFLLVIAVGSGRIWISSSGIQNNMSEDVSGRSPIRHDSEKIIFGMGDSVGKHQDGPAKPRWQVELDEAVQEGKPPRATLVRLPRGFQQTAVCSP